MSRLIAAYGGGFKPPTKGHFEVVEKALNENPEIDEFIIYVGSGERDGINQAQSILIWEIYQTYLPMKVKIEPSKAPIGDIIRLGKNNLQDEVYFVIGAREGFDDDMKDIESRTKNIEEKYPNMKIKVIQTADQGISGTNARKASQVSYEDFTKFIPSELSDKEKEEVYNIVKPSISEIKLPTIPDIKEKFKIFVNNLKQEGAETKAAFSLLIKAAKGEIELTDLDKQQIKEQLKDVLKGVFGVAILAIPAGSLVLLLLKLIKLQDLVTPTAFLEENDPEDGKAVPYGSGYKKLNENASYSKDIDVKGKIMQLTQHMLDKGMNIEPLPKVEFVDGDSNNAREFFGKTAYYNPNNHTITLFTEGRHPKDIVRSFSHEMMHHIQNLEGRLSNITTTNTQEDDNLNDIEAEANLKGTMTFRNWTDSLNEGKKEKDPFGLNQYARELALGLEEAIVGDKIECDNCDWSWDIKDGGDDLYTCHKCWHDNTPKKLNEGRYDKSANQFSKIVFEFFKDVHDRGDKKGEFELSVGPDDEDIQSNQFEFDLAGVVEITDDEYSVDGGANAGFDNKGEEITPLLSVSFKIPKNPDWQKVSFDIKDVVRHELEHLTQDGGNVRPSKSMEDDQLIRDLIDADMLPKAQYFKLEKEVDAMLQGLYFKAKKSKSPFKDVVNDYLNIFVDQNTITLEEKEDILNTWRTRRKALSLPLFENKEQVMKYEIYSDMDGVLTDFDASFMKASDGILPSEYEKNFGKEGFWKLIDAKGVGFWVGMPWMSDGKTYWDYIKESNPILLSSPSRSSTSRLGKRLWVKNNLPGTKLILAQAKDKQNYAQKDRILIDDRPSNIEQWRASGGVGILHTSASDTIKQLKALGV